MLKYLNIKNLRTHQVLLGFLLVFVVFEISVRTELFWNIAPNSSAQAFRSVANHALEDSEPSIVIFGNSIMRNAVSSNVLADELNLDQTQVVNLSNSAGLSMDATYLYENYVDDVETVELIIVSIDPRAFDNGDSQPRSEHRFRREASLSERLMITDPASRYDLVVGQFWRTWDAKYMASSYVSELLKTHRLDRTGPTEDELGRWGVFKPETSTKEKQILNYAYTDTLDYSFYNGVHLNSFRKLMTLAKKRDIDILLVQFPVTDLYYNQITEHAGPEIEKLFGAVEEMADQRIDIVEMPTTDCLTIDSCYLDYGHMNPNGSVIYSTALAQHIKSLNLGFDE